MTDAIDRRIDRCPECGRLVDDATTPDHVRLVHWIRIVPLLASVLILAAIGIMWLVASRTVQTGTGQPYPSIVQPGFNKDDLTAIATGEEMAPHGLARGLMQLPNADKELPGEHQLGVTLLSPASARSESWSFGWPTNWYTVWDRGQYDDAVAATGLRPRRPIQLLRRLVSSRCRAIRCEFHRDNNGSGCGANSSISRLPKRRAASSERYSST